ncbi:MAG: hypothetical protein ACH34X_11100 [Thiolinea sp.]
MKYIYDFGVVVDGEFNGWFGVVMANTLSELFWQIDAHVDHYSVKIKKRTRAFSCCEFSTDDEMHKDMGKKEIFYTEDGGDDWKYLTEEFPNTGDTVFHKPSQETWLVVYADYKTGKLSWCGWPQGGEADISDCTLIKKATSEEMQQMITLF